MGRHPIVLVTGAFGQVGRALAALLPHARLYGRAELDVTDPDAVGDAITGVDHVIHLAAMTAVDRCEEEPDLARAVNQQGTQNVASAAGAARARLIYVSTDYVFDGRSGAEYREDDPVGPLNVYGHTKLGGEKAVEQVANHLTVRSSWIFGEGKNFVDTVVQRARSGAPLRVVDDQRARPTSAAGLALALVDVLERDLVGTLHVSGEGEPCSWADLASTALSYAGLDDNVQRVSTDTYRAASGRTLAARPANSTLALERARDLGVPLLDWRESVRDHVRGLG